MASSTACAPAPDSALADVRHELDELRGRIERLEQRDRVAGKPDPERDAQLLSAIALAYGSTIFTVGDLVATTNPELRAVLADCRARRLGVWLRRIHRHPAGPYRLVCIKRTGAGRVWCVCPSPSARTL